MNIAKDLFSLKYFCSFLLLMICVDSYATAPPTARQTIKSNHQSKNINNTQELHQPDNTVKSSSSLALQHPPKPYITEYVGKYMGMRITSTRKLKDLGRGVYQLSTKISSFLLKINEVSIFTLDKGKSGIGVSGNGVPGKDEAKQNILYPLSYRYNKKGFGRNKSSDLSFDWNEHVIKSNDKSNQWSLDLKTGTQDMLSFQQQLRRTLLLTNGKFNKSRLNVVNDARIKQYRFEKLTEETVHTELGYFDTIKIRQFRKGRGRQTIYWFAKQWDYIMIKVRHEEKPDKGNDVFLIKGELAGKPIRGRKSV